MGLGMAGRYAPKIVVSKSSLLTAPPRNATGFGIETMVDVKLTSKGLTMAKDWGVSNADIKYNLFFALPNMNTDQINFIAQTSGGFTYSRQVGGIIEDIMM